MKLYIKNIFLQMRDLNVKAKQTKKREMNYYNYIQWATWEDLKHNGD